MMNGSSVVRSLSAKSSSVTSLFLVKKTKSGRTNFYVNEPLFALLGR